MGDSRTAASALGRGVAFLLARQGHDGFWRDFLTPAGEASEWPTAFIGGVLRQADAETSALVRAAAALLASQRSDGGWGYNENVPSDADSTAWALRFLTRLGYRGRCWPRAAACLARHQRAKSGGIATFAEAGPIRRFMQLGPWVPFRGWCRPHCDVTATSGNALASAGGKWDLEARGAWRFVRSRQEADGSWRSYWWSSAHYATLQGVEIATVFRDYEAVRRAAEWSIQTEDEAGGWSASGGAPSAFATALCLSILVSARADSAVLERAAERLAALQDDDGGWPSHPILRIPLPGDANPDQAKRWRPIRFAGGVTVRDQHRTFTSAACVDALARASKLKAREGKQEWS
jgi:squalene cyclase